MEYLFIYLLQLADVIYGCIAFFILVSGLSATLMFCAGIHWVDNSNNKLFKITTLATVISLILLLACNLFPTKQTLLLMGGTYLGKKAINVVATDEKIKKVDTIINLQLDKYIKELQE